MAAKEYPDLEALEEEFLEEPEQFAKSESYLEVVSVQNAAYAHLVRAIAEGNTSLRNIRMLAEAISWTTDKHVREHPKWKALEAKWGRLLVNTDADKPEMFEEFLEALRKIAKDYGKIARVSEQGPSGPGRITCASLFPLVEGEE